MKPELMVFGVVMLIVAEVLAYDVWSWFHFGDGSGTICTVLSGWCHRYPIIAAVLAGLLAHVIWPSN